jgi:hypothetical protein
MRPLATIRSCEDLQRALRERAEELGVSNATLDELCGFSDRYASKVLGLHPSRALGPTSLPALLGGLGAVLILCEDEAGLARVRARLEKRQRNAKRRMLTEIAPAEAGGGLRRRRASSLWDAEGARRARARGVLILGPERRREIARAAARARWGRNVVAGESEAPAL